jgi:hypothetical protein
MSWRIYETIKCFDKAKKTKVFFYQLIMIDREFLEIARSSRALTVFEGLRSFPWIFDPVKDRSGMTKQEQGAIYSLLQLKSFTGMTEREEELIGNRVMCDEIIIRADAKVGPYE